MSQIKKVLLAFNEENIFKEISLLKNFLVKIRAEKFYIYIFYEKVDYFDFEIKEFKDEIKNFIEKNIPQNYEIIITYQEKELYDFIHKNNIDLIIAFNQKELGLIEDNIYNLVLKTNSHVLLIPENYSELNFKKIIFATDFSDYSKETLREFLSFKEIFNEAILKIVHVAVIPVGYHYTGLTLEEFSNKLKEKAVEKMLEFKKELNIDLSYEIFSVYKHKNIVSKLQEIVAEEKIDLVVIGNQGFSSKLNLLTPGSTTEKMIHIHTSPLLIMKIKERHKTILEKILLPD